MANTLRFKRGLAAGLPASVAGEPLFTTDTFDLYIGTGSTNQQFQKYIASGTTLQYLRGDGSLATFPTITNGTVTSVAATAGTGITISGSPITTSGTLTITNSAPDQVVTLTGAGATTISGTYPNFTITSAISGAGTVTSVDLSVPTGLTVSGNPITTSGTLAIALASGYVIPTTSSATNWDAAYNDKINSAAVTGTTTKTLTLTQQDGGTITANWTDDNTDAVTSVFGRTGAVIATSGDYTTTLVTEGTNLYYTDTRARLAISETITGVDYNNSTGVFSLASGYVIPTQTTLDGKVPYTGATGNVDLGTHTILAQNATIASSGSGDTATINHTSGSGIALNITKGGNGEGLYINKTSGSGNAATIIGTLNATTLVKSGGTSSQFLKADGTVDSTSYGTGSVTSVAALTLGTTGTDLSSTVANGTTTPVITLQVPTASASNRGALSSTDWTTFNAKEPAITAGTSSQYFRGDKTFQTLDTLAVPENTNLYFTEDRVRTSLLTGLNLASGGTIAATDNVLVAFGKVQNQISALVGGVNYDGTWDASTNTPTIVSGTGSKGDYYVVSAAGSTNIDGITDWKIGDWIIFNGTTWDKVDNTDAVSSVNGYTGTVSLVTGDVLEGSGSLPSRPSQLYFTDARARAAISLTVSGASGASTYDSGTGVLNVPTYTLSGLGGVPSTRTLTINGTSLDLSENRSFSVGTVTSVAALTLGTTGTDVSSTVANGTTTPVITLNIPTASATNRGALSSADWSTFNAKQNALSFGNLTEATSSVLTITGGTGAVIGSGTSIQVKQASGSVSGFLSSTDWTTFNNKQNALTNPVTGTGTTNYLPKFTGASTIGDSQIFDNGTNVGVGTATPRTKTEFASGLPTAIPTHTNTTNGIVITDTGDIYGRIGVSNFASGGGGYPTYIQAGDWSGATYYNLLLNPLGGNVGIGNTSPSYKLDVTGTGRFNRNDSGNINLTLANAFINQGNLINFVHNSGGSTTNGYIGHGGDSTGNFVIINNSITALSLARSTGAATFSSSVTAGGVIMSDMSTTAALPSTSGSTQSGGHRLRLTTNGAETAVIDFGTAGGSGGWVQATNKSDLSTNYPFLINPNGGNVGIGTATPAYTLDVTGQARVSDAIAIGTTPDTNVPFKILKNINATVGIHFQNTSTSSLAFSAIQLGTDVTGATAFTNLVYASSGITESGVYKKSGTALINTGAGGLNFLSVSQPIRFFTSTGTGTLRALITNDGDFTQFNGTNPAASTTDAFRMYSADVVAGNAAPHFRTENGAVIKLYQETTSVGNSTISVGGGSAVLDDTEFGGYTLRQVVKALQNQGILA